MSAPVPKLQELRVPVAIIGGGFSGAAVAWHLARLRPELARIAVIEPRPEIGRGLAYSASDPSHRINVPAARMSLLPDQPEHFADWLRASGELARDPAAVTADGRAFPARAVFGLYVNAHIRALGERIVHIVAVASGLSRTPDGWRIACPDGRTVVAGLVVLAVCHAPAAAPGVLAQALAGDPRFLSDPWDTRALADIRSQERVLIVGSGLTMADLVATLDRLGHAGEVVALSRRGLRSRGHPDVTHDPYGDFASDPAPTARELVRRVRATVRAALDEGKNWQAVLDQVRWHGPAIWRALPLAERRRLLRHLRPFWDVHRFRIAPQVEAGLERRAAEGRFTLRAASLKAVRREGGRIAVTLRDRRTGAVETQSFDRVVLATGPAHGSVFASNPLLGALEAGGLARPDPLRLGIAVDETGHVLAADGTPQHDLFLAGPLARGTVGELMGLPDVTNYAIRIAQAVDARLGETAADRAA